MVFCIFYMVVCTKKFKQRILGTEVITITFFIVGVKYIWTSGRLCNFDGCDRPDFEPKNINGWFWSANQARLAPSNSRNQFHDWSQTGG